MEVQDFDGLIDRLMQVSGCKTLADLSVWLGFGPNYISVCKQRKVIDIGKVLSKVWDEDITWILKGIRTENPNSQKRELESYKEQRDFYKAEYDRLYRLFESVAGKQQPRQSELAQKEYEGSVVREPEQGHDPTPHRKQSEEVPADSGIRDRAETEARKNFRIHRGGRKVPRKT
jgi:hypothetical protein